MFVLSPRRMEFGNSDFTIPFFENIGSKSAAELSVMENFVDGVFSDRIRSGKCLPSTPCGLPQ